MAKHFIRASWDGAQLRINIPKMVVRGLEWEGVSHFVLVENKDKTLMVRRFIDGESLKSQRDKGKPGPD